MEKSTTLNEYIAFTGNSRDERMWNNVSQVEKILSDLEKGSSSIQLIRLSNHSISYDVAEALSIKIKNLKNLTHADYRDIFVSRLREEIPKSLTLLVQALTDKNITFLDLSDNAFGPIGVTAFDFYLSSTTTLKELYLENNGLGPEGAESVAKALNSNKNLNLELIRMGRNRLEDKGATAFGEFFKNSTSIKEVVCFQNGIREDGMKALLNGLKSNKGLRILRINDNLIKSATDELIDLLNEVQDLEILDISDSLLGCENAIRVFKTLSQVGKIKEVYCNYNEIESEDIQEEILELIKSIPTLVKLEIKGNEISKDIFKKIREEPKYDFIEVYSENEMDDEDEDLAKEFERIKIK